MKKIKAIMAIVLFLSTCLISEGQTTQKRKIESFDKISVFGNMAVYLTKGSAEKFEIEVEDNSVDPSKVTAEMEGKKLKVKMTSQLLSSKVKVKINITYKEIQEISADGSAEIFVDSVVRGDKLILVATTNGTITLGVDLKTILAEVTEGSVISIEGYVKSQIIEVATGGTYSGFDLISDETTVKASSNGKAKVNVVKEMIATTSTGGYVGYQGDPKSKTINNKLGGKVIKDKD